MAARVVFGAVELVLERPFQIDFNYLLAPLIAGQQSNDNSLTNA
jgi:hypothetical protein